MAAMSNAANIVTVEQWLELPGPHKDSGMDERWREELPAVVVPGVGEFFQTENVEPTLGWTWYHNEMTIPLRSFAMIIGDTQASSPYRFMDVCAAIGSDEILFAERRSSTIWHAGRDRPSQAGAHLSRPRDLNDSYLFLKFRVSPDGRWILAFTESGFAAFENFELKMMEQYDELLWEPVEITNSGATIEHYDLGKRQIAFGVIP